MDMLKFQEKILKDKKVFSFKKSEYVLKLISVFIA